MLAPEAEAKHDAPFFSATSRLGVSASRFATGFLVTLVHACADLCKHNDRHFFEEEVGRECGKHVREHVACLHSFRLAPQKPAGNRSLQLAGRCAGNCMHMDLHPPCLFPSRTRFTGFISLTS